MKAAVEETLAALMGDEIAGLTVSVPQYAADELPDSGTTLVVIAEVDHRGGPAHVADVTFQLQTVGTDGTAASAHAAFEQSVKAAAMALESTECGETLGLVAPAYFLGQEGRVEGNRWSSDIRVRYGLVELTPEDEEEEEPEPDVEPD